MTPDRVATATSGRLTRRQTLLAATATALAARPARAVAQAALEADVLSRAVRLELTSLFAYDRVVASGLLRPREQRRAERLLGHEAEHARALAVALRDLGGAVPDQPRTLDDVEVPAIRAGLDRLDDRGAALAVLVEVERLSTQAHQAAIGRLRDARHIQLAATILAAEAAHLVAWRTVG